MNNLINLYDRNWNDRKAWITELLVTGYAKLSALFQIEHFYPDFEKYSVIHIIVRLLHTLLGSRMHIPAVCDLYAIDTSSASASIMPAQI